jgi:plasmid stabilization system protein ParE
MSRKTVRLTRRAKARFRDIGRWTEEAFGRAQAASYLAKLLERVDAVAGGSAQTASCRVLAGPDVPEDYRFVRAGQHFVVFVETGTEVVVVDFIHSRMDLPGKVAGLGKGGER